LPDPEEADGLLTGLPVLLLPWIAAPAGGGAFDCEAAVEVFVGCEELPDSSTYSSKQMIVSATTPPPMMSGLLSSTP
jgi:hypothetical protein